MSIIGNHTHRVDVPLFIDGDVLFSSEGITQGDPLAMVMYAIGVLPLIHHLTVSQVWYADDATALGSLHSLRCWWEELLSCGSTYGYFANPTKSWLIVKPEFFDAAQSQFSNSNINITSEGRRYLGSPIGSDSFVFMRKLGYGSASLINSLRLLTLNPILFIPLYNMGFLVNLLIFLGLLLVCVIMLNNWKTVSDCD